MENQHRKIKGYRELSEQEIELMNEVKEIGVKLGDLIYRLKQKSASQDGPDARWLTIGQIDLQKGLMALTRSIARPEFF